MFKRITAKNLFSWENLDYEIHSGISQICGHNYDDGTSEGSGKSSIPNILCWVLYGGIPKSARIDDVIRQGCDGGSGEVALDSGYCVSRSRRPNDLAIRTPAGKTVKGKDAKETQQMINKLIGLDFSAFCQTVYFAQDYPNKFISSSETDKAAILSEIQDLSKLDRARKKVQEDLKQALEAQAQMMRHLERVEADVKRVSSNMDLLESFIKRFDVEKKEKLKKLQKEEEEIVCRLNDLSILDAYSEKDVEKELTLFDQALKALEAAKVECSVTLATADAVRRDRATLRSRIKSGEIARGDLEEQLQSLATGNKTPGACPACGQAASGEKLEAHKTHVESQKRQLKKMLGQNEKVLQEAQTQMASLKEPPSTQDSEKLLKEIETEAKAINAAKKKLWQFQSEHKVAVQDALRLRERAKVLVTEISATVQQKPTEQETKLKVLHDELIGLDVNAEELKDSMHLQERVINNYEILKTGFKEVKQYIFQSLLNELSIKSTLLASELFEVPVSIQFANEDDEGGITKIKTVVTLDGNARSLGLLSGGQLARTTLAVDLALASIVATRSENPLNFRILDEPFKNLSESSMSKVVELLSKLKGTTVVIEHNSLIKSIIHRTFNIEYRDGISHAA